MPGPLEKRLLFVTGKGGVGKSTVAMTLGLLAARRGRRTIVAELARQDRVARAFAHDAAHDAAQDAERPFEEIELAPGLHTISIDPQHAMEEYLRVKAGRLAEVLSSSRMFGYLAAATPGMRELLTIGKVWELAQDRRRTRGGEPYDLVIVDAPASGHGAALLRTPRTFADTARVGPIAQQGRAIDATLRDPRQTGVVAVALAEEMPVTETLALRAELRKTMGLELALIVVNALYPRRFDARDMRALTEAAGNGRNSPRARAALRAARSEHSRARAQREQCSRLARRDGEARAELPFVFAPELDRAALEELADVLESAL